MGPRPARSAKLIPKAIIDPLLNQHIDNLVINNLRKKIIEDLEKVGFPTEVVVTSTLEKAGWIVYPGALFEDNQENKTREIDTHAVKVNDSLADQIKRKTKPGGENKLISHLIIEVKKSDKPWIFFDNGRPNWPLIPEQNFKSEIKDIPIFFDELKILGLNHHRYIRAKFHKSYHVAFSSPSSPSVIYESLVKSAKALEYFKGIYGIGGYALHLFIPVIVLDGSLWSASLDTSDEILLKRVKRLLVSFSQLAKYEHKNTKYEEEQVCEVVTREAFPRYLDIISKDNQEIYKAWTNKIIVDKL